MSDNPTPAGSDPEPESPDTSPESPTRGSVEVQPPEPKAGQHLPATTGAARQGFLARVLGGRARRDQQLQTLQSGYVEMLDMMRSISRHLDRQAEAQDQLLKTLDHFPDAVDGLRNVGKATEQQIAVLGTVREQLEANSHRDQEIVKSMEGFNKTLTLMDETTRTTTATIGDLVENSRDAEDELRAMLERSERRLTILTGVLGTFGLLAIAAAIYLGLSQGRARQSAAADTQGAAPAELSAEEPVDSDMATAGMPAETPLVMVAEPAPEEMAESVLAEAPPTEAPPAEVADAETTTAAPVEAAEAPAESTAEGSAMEPAPDEATTEPAPADMAPDAAGETAEPAGVKNVVRRFFSFLGDEDSAETPAAESPAGETPAN